MSSFIKFKLPLNFNKNNFNIKVRKMGSFLSGLIMPSIGILIAWGLWTAMFLYDYKNDKPLGWFNVPILGRLVEPGIKWLLPILIAFNGGYLIYQIRGGMIATFVIVCTIVGTDYIYANWIYLPDGTHPGSPNQFIGAMFWGPISALIFKNIEKLYITKITPSFEMLIKNFGLGLFAFGIGIMAFFSWGWLMWGITWTMMKIILAIGDNKWIAPLIGFFTEPIKVSFLNNALNHGVLGPIGYNQVQQLTDKGIPNPRSIFFLYDPNPGPGLGLLLAYAIWKKDDSKANAAGSAIIHTIGGIHEVYFPFILSKPKMLISTTLGVVGAQFVTSYFGGGTIATPSPGSIISLIALSPGTTALVVNIISFIVGVVISFSLASGLLLFEKKGDNSKPDTVAKLPAVSSKTQNVLNNAINSIVVVCEAGMGSSAMAAGVIRKYIKSRNLNINVTNKSIKELSDDYDIVVTMKVFENVVKEKAPSARLYLVDNYLGKGIYDNLFALVEQEGEK